MNRMLYYLLAGLLIVPIQSFILGRFGFVKPDLSLLVVFFAGLLFGEEEGVAIGVFLGFVLDIFYGGILGINFFSKGVIGYISGSIGRHFLNNNPMFNIISIFILSLVDLLISALLLSLFYKNILINDLLKEIIFPTAFYTTLMGAVISLVFARRISVIKESQ